MESGMGRFFFQFRAFDQWDQKIQPPQPYYSHTTPIRITLELRLRMRLVVLGCHDFCGAHRWTSLLFHRCLGLKKKLGWMTEWKMGKTGGKVKVRAFSDWVIGVVGAWCVVKMLKGDELLMGKCFWRLHMTDRHGGRRIIKHKDSRTNTHLQNNIHVRPIRDLHSSTQQNRSKILSGHPPEAVLPVESEQTSRWTSASITVYNPLHISIHNSNIVYTVYAYCTYVSVLILTPFMPRNTGTNCPFQKETHLFLPSVSGSMFQGGYILPGWWFQIEFLFSPLLLRENDPILTTSYFSKWVGSKPPTRQYPPVI